MSDSMWFIELGTICVTVAVVVRVWWLVVQVLRARNKRRLLSRMFGVVSDSPDFIGISAICHDIDSVSQVADLLDVEYASYELLVVMDARLKPELFHEMLRHYRMMRVDYHRSKPVLSWVYGDSTALRRGVSIV